MKTMEIGTAVEAVLARRATIIDADSGRNINGHLRRAFSVALPACRGDRDAAASRALGEALAKVRDAETKR